MLSQLDLSEHFPLIVKSFPNLQVLRSQKCMFMKLVFTSHAAKLDYLVNCIENGSTSFCRV